MNFSTKKRLGRGLAALIDDHETTDDLSEKIQKIAISSVYPNALNPRRHFDETDLDELSSSIKQKGILLPLLVREQSQDRYEIIAGERRWRAAERAGLLEVPVIVKNISDLESLEIALIENIQRADLNPLEEAQGYKELIERFGYTQHKLADSLGKSRSYISNSLRLLTLPEKVLHYIAKGQLSAGHARALVPTSCPEKLADKIVALGLSVRETEQLVKENQSPTSYPEFHPPKKSLEIKHLEQQLFSALGEMVEIVDRGHKGGYMTIRYTNREQLHDLAMRLIEPSLQKL